MMTRPLATFFCSLAILTVPAALLCGQTGKQAAPSKQKTLPELSAQEIFERVSPSVMVVESLDVKGKVTTLGSGVVIAPGRVITNRHVIEDGVSFRVVHNGKKWPAKLVKVDPDHDLAELSVAGLKAPAATVRDSSKLAVGETVYAIGAPEGLELTISEGLISGLRDFDKSRVIQTSAAISPGSSGGGLFDAQGRLVGITTFYLKEGQSLNFALPAEWTLALSRQPPVSASASGQGSRAFSALAWFELGNKLNQLKNYSYAADAFKEAVRLRPAYEEAWMRLGATYGKLGRYDSAVSAEREAIRLKPGDGGAWAVMGAVYYLHGRYKPATSALRRAVRLKASDEDSWELMGDACFRLGNYDEAASAEREAIRLKPDDAEAWFKLGLALLKLDRRHSEVTKVYEKLKVLDPKLADKFIKEAAVP